MIYQRDAERGVSGPSARSSFFLYCSQMSKMAINRRAITIRFLKTTLPWRGCVRKVWTRDFVRSFKAGRGRFIFEGGIGKSKEILTMLFSNFGALGFCQNQAGYSPPKSGGVAHGKIGVNRSCGTVDEVDIEGLINGFCWTAGGSNTGL